MKKRKLKDFNRERLSWYLSPDMLVYLAFPIVEIWRTISLITAQGDTKFFPLLIMDGITLILSCILLTIIYKRNKDTQRRKSRSREIIILFAIILLIATVKNVLTIQFLNWIGTKKPRYFIGVFHYYIIFL